MEKNETFQLEITMAEGQITKITPLSKDLRVSEPVPSLDKLPEALKKEIISSMQHGSMLLMGQNSPGWIVVQTAQGYTMVWR
jgi:hypothetical protein